MLQLIDKKNKLILYLIFFFLLCTINIKLTDNKKTSFTSINEITVSGLSNENNLKIQNDLKKFLFHNIFIIDKKSFEKILLNNNLIGSFTVKKIYPNLIKIKITPTEFLAIINKKNINFFIGSNGKLIKVETQNQELPFIFGKINYKNFINLKKIIDKSKFNYKEISFIYFFPSNRWDLKTKDGLLIKLPEKDLLKALRIAYKIKNDNQFKMKKIIDLRIPNKVITSE